MRLEMEMCEGHPSIDEQRSLGIISCAAAHDALDNPKNHAFGFCKRNVLCTHGDNLEKVIIKNSHRIPDNWDSWLTTIENIRLKLGRAVDAFSVLRRHVRINIIPPEDVATCRAFLESILGPDESTWAPQMKAVQLRIAAPLIEIARRLGELGIINFDDRIVQADVDALIAHEQVKNEVPLEATVSPMCIVEELSSMRA